MGQGTAQNFTYVYDRYGNRWQQNVTAGSGPQFQIGFDKGNNRDCDGCYDAAGNKTYDGIHNYTYDAEGNVTAVDGGQTATYTYDALNRRFRVKNAQNTVDYQFDVLGRRSVVWLESADFGIRDTYWWGGQPFAYHGFSGGTYYEQQDWLGTERLRTDSSGKTVATYFSLPFGDGFSTTGGSDETPDHFAGTERDAETATDHAQFRQYQEGLGRWMSGDPYLGSYNFGNPQSLNRYSYAGNNPLALRDPSGLDSQDCWYQQATGLDPNCSDDPLNDPNGPTDPPTTQPTYPLPGPCDIGGCGSFGGSPSPGGGGGGQAPNRKRPIPGPSKTCPSGGNAPPLIYYQAAGQAAADSMVSPDSLQRFVGFQFNFSNLLAFHRGGALDAQAFGGSTPYANYAYGVYMASAGYSLSQALQGANLYASMFASYGSNVPLDPNYKGTPASNVTNITNGFNNQQAGALKCP